MPSMKGLRSTRLKPLPFGVVQHPKDATLGFGTGHQLRRGNPIVVEAGVGISSFVFHRILSRVVVAAALFVLGAGFVSPISAAVEFPTLVLSSNLQARVYARSNVVGNVVAMCFDRQGRLLTVDANRRLTGTWGDDVALVVDGGLRGEDFEGSRRDVRAVGSHCAAGKVDTGCGSVAAC